MSQLATKLSSFLVAPTRVASLLDWKRLGGTVMALDISADQIGVAIAEHPSNQEPVYKLDPIQIVKDGSATGTKYAAIRQLEDVVKDERVCAFIVRWPLQNGRMGAPCGKVLHTLESLTLKKGSSLVGKNRPFTLWDDQDNQDPTSEEEAPDEWGRLAAFGRAPEFHPDMSYSSKAHTNVWASADSSAAARMLDSFLKDNWQTADLADRRKKYSSVETRRQAPKKQFVAESTSIDEGGEQVYISQSLL